MVRAGDRLRVFDELCEREMIGRVGRAAEAVPRGDAVAGDASGGDLLLEQLEGRADAGPELRPRHAPELRLRVVDVVQVDARDAEVPEAPADLVGEEAGRHRVRAARDLLRLQDTRLHVRIADVRRRVRRDALV